MKENYGLFGLNRRQIEIIASATKKLHYYYVSSYGSRLFQLALDACPVSLAYVAVNTEGVIAAKEIFRKYGADGFNRRWLIYSHIIEDETGGSEEEAAVL